MGSYLGWRSRSQAAVAAVCALGLLLVPPAGASAQSRLLDEYVLTSWTDEEGLFGGWIVGIAQDRDGYMWVGTVSGLIRFDGLNFERFHGTDGAQLPQRSVSSLYAASDGSIWVGYSGGGGIYRIRQRQVKDYGPADGLGGGRIAALTEDGHGVMFAATPDGLYRLERERWQKVAAGEGLPDGQVYSIYRDRTNALWAATSDAVFRRTPADQAFAVVTRTSEAPLGFSEAPDGEMWVTSPTVGFRRIDLRQHDGAPGGGGRRGHGARLLHDRAGNLWVATLGRGLWFMRNGASVPEAVGRDNGLSNDSVRGLFEDRHGDVWVGTTVGLHRFARRRVTPYTDLGVVRALEAGHDGAVWVATGGGVVQLLNGRRRHFGVADGLPSVDVRGLHVSRSGQLWVTTAGGVAAFTDGRFLPVRLDQGRWPTGTFTMATDSKGRLWLCSEDYGLFRWDNGRVQEVSLSLELHSADIHSVAVDRADRLWLLMSGGGVGLLEADGGFRLLRKSDRFHRSDLAFHEDDAGTIWLGAGERLTRFKDGVLAAVTVFSGLPAAAIRSIAGDRDGNLWIGTSGGIMRMAASEFEVALREPNRRLEFRSYSSSDGLPGVPVRNGYPSAIRAENGHLWFVTGNGATEVDPRRLSATRPPAPVRIQRVNANGRSFEPSGSFELPPRTTSLQIDYTALEFYAPRQLQFRYRLVGLDDGWTDAGPRRQALFTNLPPRAYRFEVMARSSEGIWNPAAEAVEFSIQPMFYQTAWFAGLVITALAAAIALAWRVRRQQVRRRFELVLTERARMAREIHDTLLQSLAGLELQVDAIASQLTAGAPVRQQMERVRRQIQSDVSEARQSIWALRSPSLEARDLATALRELGQTMAATSGIDFQFSVAGRPARCAGKVEEHLLRVGLEAVSNAVRHAHASLVRLELLYGDDSITLRVCDDGRGFDREDAARRAGTHWGLATMQERADAIGGRLQLVSRPGVGTNLEMIAPLLSPSKP
ncbi:MAG: two-component regulator propeller domain-containing protein [Vicinamibacterales bacterium]